MHTEQGRTAVFLSIIITAGWWTVSFMLYLISHNKTRCSTQ